MESRASPFQPAAYGKACGGCSRAKCKCFYRSDGSGCERCNRLGRVCEPAVPVRKRKAQPQQLTPPPPPPPSSSQPLQSASRLEEKLDDLVTLLKSQAETRHSQELQTSPSNNYNTPSTTHTLVEYTARTPNIAIDKSAGLVQLMRPEDGPDGDGSGRSILLHDVSVHAIGHTMAEQQLETFRSSFLPMFPFVHLPRTLRPTDLQQQRPFLWLVIMTLTTKSVNQQFAMEDTIWQILSQRAVVQHHADLDLVLGLICFAAWSHTFKKDRPFMCTVAQLAVSVALELNLHTDAPPGAGAKTKRLLGDPEPRARTMEERRAILGLFHVTSITWNAYRKMEPLRWSTCLDECLRTLSQTPETHLDIALVFQVKCLLINNQLTGPDASTQSVGVESHGAPSPILVSALLAQLGDVESNLPREVRSMNIIHCYIHNTELTIRESVLRRPRVQDHSGVAQMQRLQDLEATLSAVEKWMQVLPAMRAVDWAGINVDNFTQFTHCLVVLFKLTTLNEPGWDTAEVKRRLDLFDIMDKSSDLVASIPREIGLIEADGPRKGIFPKAAALMRAIKALFMAELKGEQAESSPPDPSKQTPTQNDAEMNASDFDPSLLATDEFLLNFSNEPWLADIFTDNWYLDPSLQQEPIVVGWDGGQSG